MVAVPNSLQVGGQCASGGGCNKKVAAKIRQARQQRIRHIATVSLEEQLVVGEILILDIETQHASVVAFAMYDLVTGLEIALRKQPGEALGFTAHVVHRRIHQHGDQETATGTRLQLHGVGIHLGGFEVSPMEDHSARGGLGTMKDRGHPMNAECGFLVNMQLQMLIVMVNRFRKVLWTEPDQSLLRRRAFFARLKNKASVSHGGESRATKSLAFEKPIDGADT